MRIGSHRGKTLEHIALLSPTHEFNKDKVLKIPKSLSWPWDSSNFPDSSLLLPALPGPQAAECLKNGFGRKYMLKGIQVQVMPDFSPGHPRRLLLGKEQFTNCFWGGPLHFMLFPPFASTKHSNRITYSFLM